MADTRATVVGVASPRRSAIVRPGPRRPRRTVPPLVVAGVLVAGSLLVGCSSAAGSGDPNSSAAPGPAASTTTVTAGTVTPQVSTVTSTVPGNTIFAAPPAPTPEPPPVDGTCPYLADEVVADVNGQHTGTTQLVDLSPYPMCVFYRADGEWLASVRIIRADTPQAAVAAVDAHVPIEGSDPASQPPGWSGGSMVTDAGSVYAVSKDTLAVIAESNQRQSIKGRQLVITAVQNLGL